MSEQQSIQTAAHVSPITKDDPFAIQGTLPESPRAAPYSKRELIVSLHELLVDLQNSADTMLKSEDPREALYQRLNTATATFVENHPSLLSAPQHPQESLEIDPKITAVITNLRTLRELCPVDGSAMGQVEYKTLSATIAVVRTIATECLTDFDNMRFGYSPETKEHYAAIAKENLLRQIRHGFGATLLHTGSISEGNALLASESDFIVNERALKIVAVLSYLSRLKYDSLTSGGIIFNQRGMYDRFSLDHKTDEESFEQLKDFCYERYRALQPQAIALLEALVVARTRHLLTMTDLYLSNREFAETVKSTDPIDLFQTKLQQFPQLATLRPEVACCGDFTGPGYTFELQQSLSRCFVEWGVDRRERPCNDFIDVVHIVRGDWPSSNAR